MLERSGRIEIEESGAIAAACDVLMDIAKGQRAVGQRTRGVISFAVVEHMS